MNPDCKVNFNNLYTKVGALEIRVEGESKERGAFKMMFFAFGITLTLAFLMSAWKWFEVASDLATIKTKLEYMQKP